MNSFFKFKQFTIHQDKCAMKVCTDACLFGAIAAKEINVDENSALKILDIGAGTGLLSLMVAQKTTAKIDAVEIDEAAATQAAENCKTSIFPHYISVFNESIITFKSTAIYDYIISNPPFYENQLKSLKASKNEAMHSTSLQFSELFTVIKSNLAINGKAFILIPYSELGRLKSALLQVSLFIVKQINIKQTTKHQFFRVVVIVSHSKQQINESTIEIKDENNVYTQQFIDLLSPYYLAL